MFCRGVAAAGVSLTLTEIMLRPLFWACACSKHRQTAQHAGTPVAAQNQYALRKPLIGKANPAPYQVGTRLANVAKQAGRTRCLSVCSHAGNDQEGCQ
jgi:hypothetical protein